ncbi:MULTISPECIES: hypothetical protein [unclassified Streptomyces]|uniref:hypothetical protein n=1 Tax=unclassified Streptomyces TaxID=2593676 RepID=UPI0033BB22E6
MRLPSRATRAVCAVAALPLALSLAACDSGDSGSSSDSKGSAGKVSAAPSKSTDPNAGVLTGTQLKQALAPVAFMPKGLTAVKDGEVDSGDEFTAPPTKTVGKPDCSKFGNTYWLDVTGLRGGVSFAQSDFTKKPDEIEQITQELDGFRGTTAQTVMKDIRAAVAACPAFTDTELHAKVKIVGKETPGLGDEAYTITLTSPTWDNGTTLIAARVGTSVLTLMSTAGSDNGAAAAQKVATQVVTSLKAQKPKA